MCFTTCQYDAHSTWSTFDLDPFKDPIPWTKGRDDVPPSAVGTDDVAVYWIRCSNDDVTHISYVIRMLHYYIPFFKFSCFHCTKYCTSITKIHLMLEYLEILILFGVSFNIMLILLYNRPKSTLHYGRLIHYEKLTKLKYIQIIDLC